MRESELSRYFIGKRIILGKNWYLHAHLLHSFFCLFFKPSLFPVSYAEKWWTVLAWCQMGSALEASSCLSEKYSSSSSHLTFYPWEKTVRFPLGR